jgi:hypothetical protein
LYGDLSAADNCYLQSVTIATNIALNKASWQTPDDWSGDYSLCGGTPDAGKANDGNLDGDFNNCSVSSTGTTGTIIQWGVDLAENYDIKRIVVYNRTDAGRSSNNLTNFTVEILKDDNSTVAFTETYNSTIADSYTFEIPVNAPITGQYVEITSNIAAEPLQIAEVEVYGVLEGAATENVAL